MTIDEDDHDLSLSPIPRTPAESTHHQENDDTDYHYFDDDDENPPRYRLDSDMHTPLIEHRQEMHS